MPRLTKQQGGSRRAKPTKTSKSAVDRIYNSIDEVPEEGSCINLYGRSKTGKTRLLSTFPKPILHLICSSIGIGEIKSIRNVKGVCPVEIKEPDDISELAEHVRKNPRKYATIGLDHLTGFSDLVLARILGLERLPEQNSWGMASIKQYQQRGIQVKEYVADLIGLKTLGVNVVVIAQEKLFKFSSFDDEDSSLPQAALDVIAPLVGSDTGESIYRWLNAAADYICQTCIRPQVITVTKSVGKGDARKEVTRETPTGKFDYCLRIGPSDIFTTGFRTSQDIELPQFIINPTYEKITKLL